MSDAADPGPQGGSVAIARPEPPEDTGRHSHPLGGFEDRGLEGPPPPVLGP